MRRSIVAIISLPFIASLAGCPQTVKPEKAGSAQLVAQFDVPTSSGAGTAITPSAAPAATPGRNIHIYPLGLKVTAMAAGIAGSPHLAYHGGRVISNVRVAPVFWGGNVNADVRSKIGGFYSTLTGPYMDWLGEYDTAGVTPVDGNPGSNQRIGRGTVAGPFAITPANTGNSLQDSDIVAELDGQVRNGNLPANDLNTLYMVYFPPSITITSGGSRSCVAGGFCAYHGTFTRTGADVFYGVVPDFGPGGGCDSGCGSGSTFENVTSVSSHEVIEAVTDAEVGLTTTVQRPLAWYDANNGEIGDICNQQETKFGAYVVQREWSNRNGICFVPSSAFPSIFESGTTFAQENDGTWLMADYDGDGRPDLVFIKASNTGTGTVEVHVASAAPIFKRASSKAARRSRPKPTAPGCSRTSIMTGDRI